MIMTVLANYAHFALSGLNNSASNFFLTGNNNHCLLISKKTRNFVISNTLIYG